MYEHKEKYILDFTNVKTWIDIHAIIEKEFDLTSFDKPDTSNTRKAAYVASSQSFQGGTVSFTTQQKLAYTLGKTAELCPPN